MSKQSPDFAIFLMKTFPRGIFYGIVNSRTMSGSTVYSTVLSP